MGWWFMKKYDNYTSHLAVLRKSPEQDLRNEFILSGIIDKFFIQFELGWKERNNTAHIYDGEAARKLTDRIITEFIPEFEELQSNIEKQYKNVLKNMQ